MFMFQSFKHEIHDFDWWVIVVFWWPLVCAPLILSAACSGHDMMRYLIYW
jgi:hypothetical protein